MTCGELQGLHSLVLDGEASAAERELVRHHLGTCPHCRTTAAAAGKLRCFLSPTAAEFADDPVRDEELLAVLRSEGLFRGERGQESGVAHQTVLGYGCPQPNRWMFRPVAGSLARMVRRIPWGCWLRLLGPGVAATAASFLLTWGSLRGAELVSSPAAAAGPNVSASSPGLDDEALEQWFGRSPTLGDLAMLRSRDARRPERRRLPRRGAALPRERAVS
jgi:anti-sigma factor RsiW